MKNLATEFIHTFNYQKDNQLLLRTIYKAHRIYIKRVYWNSEMNWLVGYVEVNQTDLLYSQLVNDYKYVYTLPFEKEVTSINDLEIDGKKLNSVFLGFDTAEPFERNTNLSDFENILETIVNDLKK